MTEAASLIFPLPTAQIVSCLYLGFAVVVVFNINSKLLNILVSMAFPMSVFSPFMQLYARKYLPRTVYIGIWLKKGER